MNVEYGDYHKFIASIGVGLISLSFLVPWLFLKEPFDLLVKEQDIKLLTQIAQDVLQQRQEYVSQLFYFIKIFSIVSFILGLILLVWGGCRWRKMQRIIDEQKEVDLEAAKRKLQSSSPQQIEDKREAEANEQIDQSELLPVKPVLTKSETISQPQIKDYIYKIKEIENQLTNRLKNQLDNSYEVLSERRIGIAIYDIILLAKSKPLIDYVIEIKYVRKGFKYGWVRDNLFKTMYSTTLYEKETKRRAIAILIIVIGKDASKQIEIENYKQRALKETLSYSSNAIVTFIEENTISSLSYQDIISNILGVESRTMNTDAN